MAFPRFGKKKSEIPSDLVMKCEKCAAPLLRKELEKQLFVCPNCGQHHRVTGRQRMRMLVDPGSFEEHAAELGTVDRLGFRDKETYAEKIVATRRKSSENEAAILGIGAIEGRPVVLCCLDFSFLGGSMGCVVGEKVALAVEMAMERSLPVIVVSASGGARMHEGALSLMQMAKTSATLARHHASRGLFISVLTNPTTGGVMASFAALGDFILAEPGALIGFAGPRVIQETLRTELPEGFQRAEFLLERGFVDRIVARKDLRPEIRRIIDWCWSYTPAQLAAATPPPSPGAAAGAPAASS